MCIIHVYTIITHFHTLVAAILIRGHPTYYHDHANMVATGSRGIFTMVLLVLKHPTKI